MTARVRLTPTAKAQARRIDAWWRANRPGSPDLFVLEFARAVALFADTPGIGRRYEGARTPGVRRYLLRATGHHVYYAYDERALTVRVLAVWNAIGGDGPDV